MTHWAKVTKTDGTTGYFIDALIPPGFDVSQVLVTAACPYACISAQAALQAAGLLTTAGYFTAARVLRKPRLDTLSFESIPTYAAGGDYCAMVNVQEGAHAFAVPTEPVCEIKPIPTPDVASTTGLISTVAYLSDGDGWTVPATGQVEFNGFQPTSNVPGFLPPNLYRKWKLTFQTQIEFPIAATPVGTVTLTIINSANPNGLLVTQNFSMSGAVGTGNYFFYNEIQSMGYNPAATTTRPWETGVLASVKFNITGGLPQPQGTFVRIETYEDVVPPYVGPTLIVAYDSVAADQKIGVSAVQAIYGEPQTNAQQYIRTFETKTNFDLDVKIGVEVLNNLSHFGISTALPLAEWKAHKKNIISLADRSSKRVAHASFWSSLWGGIKKIPGLVMKGLDVMGTEPAQAVMGALTKLAS